MLAMTFHRELARLIVRGAEAASEESGLRVCALSGGVFQNKLLLELCEGMLKKAGFKVLFHSMVPPNDGGVALGQAVVAAQWMADHAPNAGATSTEEEKR